jgi:hypothetical protein
VLTAEVAEEAPRPLRKSTHSFSYFTSMVETLKGGSVTVNDVPLADICETSTGCTGLCPWAELAVI